jgi:hypothetical protein
MNKRDYLEKRKEIQKDCADKLAALDKVFAMFGGTPVGGGNASDTPATGNGWNFDLSKRAAVRLALSKVQQVTFTMKDIRAVLNSEHPDYSKEITDNQISAILSWFASKKEIGVRTRKYGSSPAIYEKKAQAEEVMKAKAG